MSLALFDWVNKGNQTSWWVIVIVSQSVGTVSFADKSITLHTQHTVLWFREWGSKSNRQWKWLHSKRSPFDAWKKNLRSCTDKSLQWLSTQSTLCDSSKSGIRCKIASLTCLNLKKSFWTSLWWVSIRSEHSKFRARLLLANCVFKSEQCSGMCWTVQQRR